MKSKSPRRWIDPALLLALLALGGCGFVNPPHSLTETGTRVRIADQAAEALDCRSLGMIRARAASILGKVDIETDQQVDARNKAAALGANMVIARQEPLPVAEPGSRLYEAFLCGSM
jgi:hypothetical protein